MYALVDCNNFYVSCERLFNPKLEGKPVIVLSNNDGCVVARSQEAKKLEICMGQPLFECKHIVDAHHVQVFSSNFSLYGDVSNRVMSTISTVVPDIEIYSIDEAFLLFDHWIDPTTQAHTLRARIRQDVGIPVSIGIAPTKTLAKLANAYVKKHQTETGGVLDWNKLDAAQRQEIFSSLGVEDVWGIGRESARKLYILRVKTVADFMALSHEWVKKALHEPGVATWKELHGTIVHARATNPHQKSLMSTRSFGRPITEMSELSEALATYVASAAERLRAQKLTAAELTIFIQTNRFQKNQPQYRVSKHAVLLQPTNLTNVLIAEVASLLKDIYKKNYVYKKAGVILYGISEEKTLQSGLFVSANDTAKSQKVMRVIDAITRKMGGDAINYAAEGIKKPWVVKSNMRTPRYTTSWSELQKVN